MTRVEKQTSVAQQLEGMKKEVVREVRQHNRKRRPLLTCSLLILLLIVSVCVWVGWLLAATGLVEVPLLTSLAYDAPKPIHPVEAGTPVEVFVEEQLKSEITSRLQSGSGELQDRSVSLVISEEAFTATLRSFVEESGIALLDGSETQLALDPNIGAELFVPLKNNPRASAVIVTMEVGVVDGDITITPTHLRVGSLELPRFVVTKLLNPLLQQEVVKLNDGLTGYADIDSVVGTAGEMTLTGRLSVEIQ